MGAAAATIAGGASMGSLALNFMGAQAKGEGEKAADDYKAARAEQAAEYARTAATQTDAQGLENLTVTLQNIDAVRAAAGADPTSPTTAAIKDRTEVLADRSRGIQVNNILAQAKTSTDDAAYLRQAGEFALGMGNLGAYAGAAGTIAKTNWSTFGAGS